MKLNLKMLLLATVTLVSTAGFAQSSRFDNDLPLRSADFELIDGVNRVPIDGTRDILVLNVRSGAVTGGSVIPSGSTSGVPFTKDRPIGAACPTSTKRECVSWTPPGGTTKITCYCIGATAIKGAPMTLVNNTSG